MQDTTMARVAVFDSGLGSLSIIRAIQGAAKSEIVYFADQRNFPYGTKSRQQLGRIIERTVKGLRKEFAPDVVVMASNTPSLVLGDIRGVIGVHPPVREAAQASETDNVAVLGTKSAVASRGLDSYIASQGLPKSTTVHKIDASELVELVEAGKFLTDKKLCRERIRGLGDKFRRHAIDAATLSSTHLPFLRPLLESELGGVRFLDPAESVASEVARRTPGKAKRNTLRVYTSGDVKKFEKNLVRLGIKNRAGRLAL